MSWSLGEIEALARKAARGSGLPWGIAEEAGKATRWLCAAGLPGAEALARLLQQNDGAAYEAICPVDTSATPWQARGGALCPLYSGASLCDRADPALDLALSRVGFPILLLPYVVMAADISKTAMRIAWQGVEVTRSAHGTTLRATPEALALPEAQMIRIGPATDLSGDRLRRGYRADVDAQSAVILERFARRTYAPETEASRISGAGAGLSDND